MIGKERVLERFMESPAFLRVAEEVQAEETAKAERKAKAEELASLVKERPVVMARLAEESRQAEDKLKRAEEALKKAKTDLSLVQNKCFSEAWLLDQRIRECEGFLLSTAPQSLRDQLAKKESEIEVLRRKPVFGHVVPDYPEGVGLSQKEWERVRALPSDIEERKREVESAKKEAEKIRERILKGE